MTRTARTGSRLRVGPQALSACQGFIGAVHGSGLYLSPELVRDRITLGPATEERLCDRMLELGVVVQLAATASTSSGVKRRCAPTPPSTSSQILSTAL